MRISDLLESKNFKEYIDTEKEYGVNYDLAEDVSFFLNHDDETYRRHVYPAIMKCVQGIEHKKKTSPALFVKAAMEGYKNYLRNYPIRELPDNLNEKLIKEICTRMHEDVCKHVEEGKYKD